MSGPLGPLRGMYFDPTRNRYFPTPKEAPPSSSPLRNASGSSTPMEDMLSTNCVHGKKHPVHDDGDQAGSSRNMGRRGVKRLCGIGRRRREVVEGNIQRGYGSMRHEKTEKMCPCIHERVTDFHTFTGDTYTATTDHGKVIIRRKDGSVFSIALCAEPLFGIHYDTPRMAMMVIAAGPDPHVHLFRREPESLEHLFMQQTDMSIPRGDIYSMSSYDGVCALGGEKSMTVVQYVEKFAFDHRNSFPSDPLALHQAEPNLVYAGLRSSTIVLDDLRVQSGLQTVVAKMPKGKAVIGVKRLKDSAVPWGLVASGMENDMLIFDVRYGKQPLRRLQGHVNNYQQYLGLATTPDDIYLFAAGSDHRLRAWSTYTGEPITPEGDLPPFAEKFSSNPLEKVFEHRVQAIDVKDNWELDVIVRGELQRFGPGSENELEVDPEDYEYEYER